MFERKVEPLILNIFIPYFKCWPGDTNLILPIYALGLQNYVVQIDIKLYFTLN